MTWKTLPSSSIIVQLTWHVHPEGKYNATAHFAPHFELAKNEVNGMIERK
jgi:hypothetical protein